MVIGTRSGHMSSGNVVGGNTGGTLGGKISSAAVTWFAGAVVSGNNDANSGPAMPMWVQCWSRSCGHGIVWGNSWNLTLVKEKREGEEEESSRRRSTYFLHLQVAIVWLEHIFQKSGAIWNYFIFIWDLDGKSVGYRILDMRFNEFKISEFRKVEFGIFKFK